MRWAAWLHARAENVLALMMAVMFASFIAQVVFRYLFNLPLGWTEELCVFMWLWGILWGVAFVLRDGEEIRFDMLISHVGRGTRRAMTAASGVGAAVLLAIAMPATWSYISFMSREKSAALGIRMDWVFGLYMVFAVALIARHARLVWHAATDRLHDDMPQG